MKGRFTLTFPKIRGLRWYIAALLLLVTTINYIDRTSLAVAAPTLKSQLHIDEQQFAYIIMCFQICYMIMQPITGRILDWLNVRKGFTAAAIWWSVANILHAFARTPFTFGLFRGLLGVGEAANFPGVAKTAAEWFPPKERTMAAGIANIGSGTGALLATPLVAWIIFKFGWQEAFVFTGAIGFIWVALWLLMYRPPETHPLITPEELNHIQQGKHDLEVEDNPTEKNVWKIIIKQRNFWGVAVARFLSEPAWQFFSYWIPMFLITQKGMNIKQLAIFGWVPFLAADLGCFVGGILSPIYQKFGLSVLTARKASLTTGVLIMPMVLLVITAPSGYWAVFWLCFGGFAHSCISTTLLTLTADLFPKRTVATANGLCGGLGYFGGMLFTFSIGFIVTHFGYYKPVFIAIAAFDFIAAAAIWILLRTPKEKTA